MAQTYIRGKLVDAKASTKDEASNSSCITGCPSFLDTYFATSTDSDTNDKSPS